MSIIAISGKVGSGKDTVGKIIQALTWKDRGGRTSNYSLLEWVNDERKDSYDDQMIHNYQIKKFATKLKQITCMMLGCTLEQLENQEFKKQPLPDQWQIEFPLIEGDIKTYRWFLQILGTESTREIIHPNFWINGLFADYKGQSANWGADGRETVTEYPNWIITDLRFPNELCAIKQHKGITIRVNRKREDKYYYQGEYCNIDQLREIIYQETGEHPLYEYCKNFQVPEHESEIALDKVQFDYTIDNNGTIEELIERVRLILIQEKIM